MSIMRHFVLILFFTCFSSYLYSQNLYIVSSNNNLENTLKVQALVDAILARTDNLNFYIKNDNYQKVKLTKRNKDISSEYGTIKFDHQIQYISGLDIELSLSSHLGSNYLAFIQHPHRYLQFHKRYRDNIKDFSEIITTISTLNKRELKNLNIHLYFNQSQPSLTIDYLTDKTQFIYNRYLSGKIEGSFDPSDFNVYTSINNESPVQALLKDDGTWSTQLKNLRSNTRINRLRVFCFPKKYKTDTSNILEFSNFTFSDNPQILVTDPLNEVVSRCRLRGSGHYKISFVGRDIDESKLQFNLEFDPYSYYNRDKADLYHLTKKINWIIPWGGTKDEYENGETLYCFYINFSTNFQNSLLESKDLKYRGINDVHDCTVDFELLGSFEYEFEPGKFKTLGSPKMYQFITFTQNATLLDFCNCIAK